ncbi:MAG: ribonuclease Y [Chloroflexota bacterium]|nr:MAG: ribonuclease Y [Chloroflexota bacterium]
MAGELVIGIVVAGLVAAAVGFYIGQRQSATRARIDTAAQEAESARAVQEAESRKRELLIEARDEALKIRTEAEQDVKLRRAETQQSERRLQQKEEALDRRIDQSERREAKVVEREQELETARGAIAALKAQTQRVLENAAGMTGAEAKAVLLQEIEDEVRQDANRRVREIEAEAKEESERRAKQVITLAIQRWAGEQVAEHVMSVVHLPSDEMKGRIIGREGRNIRALEAATGVDLIIDDTPDAVTLSGFDPVRREIARMALTKLVADGRIHPARIEEVVGKAKQELEQQMREEGEQAALKAGVTGLHPEIIKLMGRLKYRTSYGQNVLNHSIEVAHLAAMIASEIGADVTVARSAGFLHDIGKAVDHEVEGPHALIGADILRRFGTKSAKVIHAVAAHHSDEEPQSVDPIIISSADAISSARPGARRETVESYIRRLEALESVANSFPGVERSFAIQAGREVRIIVKPEEIDDLASVRLARDIVKKIEDTLEYPGQIKVTLIRETRAVEYAR